MKEVWKPFRHGYYEVSNLGRVYSNVTGRFLKPFSNHKGYLQVCTYYHQKRKYHLIHRLVATAFIGPCPKEKEVNHQDLNKSNCRCDNLEYITHKRNMHHAIDHGKLGAGEKNGNSSLTWKDVIEIRRLYATGKYHKQSKTLASRFAVHPVTICKIINNRKWRVA